MDGKLQMILRSVAKLLYAPGSGVGSAMGTQTDYSRTCQRDQGVTAFLNEVLREYRSECTVEALDIPRRYDGVDMYLRVTMADTGVWHFTLTCSVDAATNSSSIEAIQVSD